MDQFDALLAEATAAVGPNYMHLPIAGTDVPAYRERVYCYELYHQMRQRWPGDTHLALGGEVDKKGHPLIRGNGLDNLKPDLLVHEPGDMGGNYAVVEVKPAEVRDEGLSKDLRTLTAFIQHGQYRRGILLIYGDLTYAPRVQSKIDAIAKDLGLLLQAVELWWHDVPGHQAKRIR